MHVPSSSSLTKMTFPPSCNNISSLLQWSNKTIHSRRTEIKPHPAFFLFQKPFYLYMERKDDCNFKIVIGHDKAHSLRPLMNSLKFMSASVLWSSRRKTRRARSSVFVPQAQGKSSANSTLNCSRSMRYCSRYGRLGSCRLMGLLVLPQ